MLFSELFLVSLLLLLVLEIFETLEAGVGVGVDVDAVVVVRCCMESLCWVRWLLDKSRVRFFRIMTDLFGN